MSDSDDELQELLGELEGVEPDNIPAEIIQVAEEQEAVVEVVQEQINEISLIAKPVEDQSIAPRPININKYLDRLDGVTDEVLNACRADRQEAQDVILLLRSQINDAIANQKQPSRMWVDGLVKAVEVKSLVNMTAVKIIEANAKILAATKAGGTNVQVNNNSVTVAGTDKDLEKILDEPLTADDEF